MKWLLILHHHMPYGDVSSGLKKEDQKILREWFLEALIWSYLPLAKSAIEGKSWYVASLSASFMKHISLLEEQKSLLRESTTKALKEGEKFLKENLTNEALALTMEHHLELIEENIKLLHDFKWKPIDIYKELSRKVPVGTTPAFHPLLTPLEDFPKLLEVCIKTGMDIIQKELGKNPQLLWLPELTTFPGLENTISKATNTEIFTVMEPEALHLDSHSGKEINPYRVYSTGRLKILVRDPLTSKIVWSADEGYPGASPYLEFHRKTGMFKLHAVTSRKTPLSDKLPYDPLFARDKLKEDAIHFSNMLKKMSAHESVSVITSAYDAELFGHWWHEGVLFIEEVYRNLPPEFTVKSNSLEDVIEYSDVEELKCQNSPLSYCSWGAKKGISLWVNEKTASMWEELLETAEKIEETIGEFDLEKSPVENFLLAAQSDWFFMKGSGRTADIGERVFNSLIEFARKHFMI